MLRGARGAADMDAIGTVELYVVFAVLSLLSVASQFGLSVLKLTAGPSRLRSLIAAQVRL